DEVWGFVGMKEKTRLRLQPSAYHVGDAYCYIGLERSTKLILAWHLGKRDHDSAHEFAGKLADATTGHFQITTDGFKPYKSAIPAELSNADFAMLIKKYGKQPETGRYSPPEVIGTITTPRNGHPDPDRVCTSHVERANLTVRMGNRRMTRLTNAFSKKWSAQAAMLALSFCYYNFSRAHQTLTKEAGQKTTPVMAAGLEDHPWTLRELVERSAQ